jgi:pre-mRNA-splicing factor SYF1
MMEYQVEEEDIPYEEDVLHHPYNFKSWWRYLEFKVDTLQRKRFLIYERALKEIPGSYKLWYHYLKERMAQVHKREAVSPDACEGIVIINDCYYDSFDSRPSAINNTFERCLLYMHKMPRIWLEYCGFLVAQKKFTVARRAFDRALRSLPLGQHERIWKLYIKFVVDVNIPEVVCRVYRRYLKIAPQHCEEYLEYLLNANQYDEAARVLAKIVDDEKYVSPKGKSKHQLWTQLCDVISRHPNQIPKEIKVDNIIRSGLQKFTDEVGRLWTALAGYYIRKSNFDKVIISISRRLHLLIVFVRRETYSKKQLQQ